MEVTATTYQPGVCNIGPAEIRRRRRAGWIGLVSAVVLAIVLVALGVPSIVRLLVAIPAALSISGFLQAHMRFCAGYGMAGLQNLGEIGEQHRVEDDAARATDRRQALKIHAASILGGLGIALILVIVPI